MIEDILIPLFAIFVIFIGCPGMIMWFSERRRRDRMKINADTGQADQQLVAIAHKMERRVQALESILDSEVPGWRKDMASHQQENHYG